MDHQYYVDSLVEDYGYSYDEASDMSTSEIRDTMDEMDQEERYLESLGWDED
jgi:hypothetical protein